jgi:hypothetical protein
MTTKRKVPTTKASNAIKEPPKYALPDELMVNAEVHAAAAMDKWGVFGDIDIRALTVNISKRVDKVQEGSLKGPEAMLFGQAMTLQAIFTSLSRRAAMNAGEYIDATDKYLRLALKAQSQCRATLETLAAIKNPPVIYAKQANFANGPQQVNNSIPAQSRAQAGIIESEPNKLLGDDNGERMDTRAQGAAGRANQVVEALG